MPIEIPMVVWRKSSIWAELAGKQTAGQRHTGENANLSLLGLHKERLCRTLTETVEYDLHRLDTRELDGF
jgi:hypothetical protein